MTATSAWQHLDSVLQPGREKAGKGAESGGAAREGRRKGGGVRRGVGKGGLPRLTRCAASVEEAGERRLHSSPKAR